MPALRPHVASSTGGHRGGKSLPRHEESPLHSGSRRTGASGRGREVWGTSSSIEAEKDLVNLARVRAVGQEGLPVGRPVGQPVREDCGDTSSSNEDPDGLIPHYPVPRSPGTPRAALNRPQARPAVFKLDDDGGRGPGVMMPRVAWAMAEQSPALDAIQVMAILGNKLAVRALQDMANQSDKVSVDALHVRAEQGDKLAVDELKTMAERERTPMDEPRAFARHQAFRLTSLAMAQPDNLDAVAMLAVLGLIQIGRPLCERCWAHRPGQRRTCPGCHKRVGPGCAAPEGPCWDADAGRCVDCVPVPEPEPEPEQAPMRSGCANAREQ